MQCMCRYVNQLNLECAALQVLVKESEGPVEHLVKVGTHAKVLEELRVVSKPAKVKNKPGRRKQKVAVEDLDDEAAEPEEHAGKQHTVS